MSLARSDSKVNPFKLSALFSDQLYVRILRRRIVHVRKDGGEIWKRVRSAVPRYRSSNKESPVVANDRMARAGNWSASLSRNFRFSEAKPRLCASVRSQRPAKAIGLSLTRSLDRNKRSPGRNRK